LEVGIVGFEVFLKRNQPILPTANEPQQAMQNLPRFTSPSALEDKESYSYVGSAP